MDDSAAHPLFEKDLMVPEEMVPKSKETKFNWKMLWNKDSAMISLSMSGAEILMSVYNLFYLKVFIDKFHLPSNFLNVVQILFLIWNAVNDPILGYMQDLGCCGMQWITDRRKVMLYAGPVFAASFLLFWFPWSTSVPLITAAQLLVSLFIFDTLLTLVLSAYCGLCVEKSPTHTDRVRVTIYGELFGLMAGFFVLPVESLTQNLDRFGIFQICCVVISIVAALCFVFCATQVSHDKPDEGEDSRMTNGEENIGTWKAVITISWQIVKEPRFICLVGSQLFKMLRLMGNEQFLIIFVEGLLVQSGFLEKGSPMLGLYYVAARAFGSILFLLLWYPVNKAGCHSVIHGINILSLTNVALMLIVGRENLAWVAAFIIIENTLSRCGAHGYYMIIAGEVIDSDKKNNERKSPLSTIIFTMKALFTKPADQLAPIIMLSLLEAGRYTQLKGSCYSTGDVATTMASTATTFVPPPGACDNMFNGMFHTLVLFPAICAVGEAIFVGADQFCKWQESKRIKGGLEEK